MTKEIPTLIMPSFDQTVLDAEDAVNDLQKDIPWRFGFNHMVNINTQNSGLWEDLGKGRKLCIRFPIKEKKFFWFLLYFF